MRRGRIFSAQKTIPSQIESIYMQIVEQISLKLSEMECHTGLSTLVHSYNLQHGFMRHFWLFMACQYHKCDEMTSIQILREIFVAIVELNQNYRIFRENESDLIFSGFGMRRPRMC